MKTTARVAAAAAWAMVCAGPAAAHENVHEGCHGLCHHWENPIYTAEMRLQMLVIAVLVAAVVVWNLAARVKTRAHGSVGG